MSCRRSITILVSAGLCLAVLSAGGASEALGDAKAGENLLVNPSFEFGSPVPDGWTKTIGLQVSREQVFSTFAFDDDAVRSGKRSLRISGDSSVTTWHSFESKPVKIRGGSKYRFSAWVKTEDVTVTGNQVHHGNLYLKFTDADGEVVSVSEGSVYGARMLEGTNDWTRIERTVPSPRGAVFAQVGCVLTCTGKVWIDDVGLYIQRRQGWSSLETDRFIFHAEDDDDEPVLQVRDALEAHLDTVESTLDIKHEGKIHYYKYDSIERKMEVTGKQSDAHVEGSEIHATRWLARHEVTLMMVDKLGDGVPLLRQGLAVYLEEDELGIDLYKYCSKQARDGLLPSVATIADAAEFVSTPIDRTFPAAGAFVRYLVEEHGLDRLKQLYKVADRRDSKEVFLKKFKEAYGRELFDMQGMWRTEKCK
ncbi:MAG: hypothetical protein JSU63_01230 [Phycisphaerales bacterium]|nr:MAG: hypothetical protein JSU63_01230 [Phycisphaerales bacterium]